jgi:hypothetical protein
LSGADRGAVGSPERGEEEDEAGGYVCMKKQRLEVRSQRLERVREISNFRI